jgi:hypothetical protein
MSLPKNCLYTNKINSSYARQYMSVIQPQNGDANLGDTIIFNVPTGNNLVMSGHDTVLKFDLTLRGAATTGHLANTIYFNKSGAYSCFQRMRIFHGGTLLSDIDNYGNLLDMLVVTQQAPDILLSKYNILAGTNVAGGDVFNTANIAADSEATSRSFCIPLLSILSLTNNYTPLFAMSGSPLRIELQVVSTVNQIVKSHVQVLAPVSKSLISKCELVCNMIEISDTGMNIIKQSIGNAPLQWVTQDYRNYGSNVTLGTSETSASVPVPAKFNSLASLFFSFRSNASGSSRLTHANESCKFSLVEYFLRIGSKTMPVKPPSTVPEMFSELLRAFGTVSDINHECGISYGQYFKDTPTTYTGSNETTTGQLTGAFYVGMDLESYSNTTMDNVYSGTNTSTDDIFFVPKFGAQGANTNIRIDAYALFDQLILIQNGVCTVNY